MVENSDYAAFMRRAVRAFVRRAGEDVDALPLLATVAEELAEAVTDGIVAAHAEGYSYGEIADRLGVTRQAVQQRAGRQARIDARVPEQVPV
jgi:DNA-directed RNA polymerase specialized sigma24 family protein